LLGGTTASSPYNSASAAVTESDGTKLILYYNSTGAVVGDDWVATDGTHGSDTFNTDGSSEGDRYNADGTFYTYAADGQGNGEQDLYDAANNQTGDNWQDADGTHGTDSFHADGSSSGMQYAADGGYSTYTDDGQGNSTTTDDSAGGVLLDADQSNVDGSTSDAVYNRDGSYTKYSDDGQGDTSTGTYSASNVLSADSWTHSDGSYGDDTFFHGMVGNFLASGNAYNADGSRTQYQTSVNNSGLVETDTLAFTSGNALSGSTQGIKNANGSVTATTRAAGGVLTGITTTDSKGNATTDSYAADGTLSGVTWSAGNTWVSTTTWRQSDGSYGSASSNSSDGSSRAVATQADGSISIALQDGKGNTTTDDYEASGALTGDSWTLANGTSGSDTFNADGSRRNSMSDGNGRTTMSNYSAAGDLTGDSWRDAGSAVTGSDTVNADGSYSSTIDDGRGNLNTETYSAAGVRTGDSWRQASGLHGTDTFNADGSSVATTYNTDGSVLVTTQDGKGDSTSDSYSSAGLLLGDTWLKADGSFGSDSYNADAIVTASSSNTPTKFALNPLLGGASNSQVQKTYAANGSVASDSWTNPNGAYGADIYSHVDWGGPADLMDTGIQYNTDGSYTEFEAQSDGTQTSYFDNYTSSGRLLSDSYYNEWSTGVDIYNADGSSSGFDQSPEEKITYTVDGKGDYQYAIYDSSNALIASGEQAADGSGWFKVGDQSMSFSSTGSGATSIPGLTIWRSPGPGSTVGYSLQYSVPNNFITVQGGYFGTGSVNIDSFVALGHYLGKSVVPAAGNTLSTVHDHQGNEVGDTWTGNHGDHGSDVYSITSGGAVTFLGSNASWGNGHTYDAGDGSVIKVLVDVDSNVTTSFYDATGNATGSFTVNAAGKITASSGGAFNHTEYYADGSYNTYISDGKGDISSTNNNSGGQPMQDIWTQADGTWGADRFPALFFAFFGITSNGPSGTVHDPDGSYGSYTYDWQGTKHWEYFSATGANAGSASYVNGVLTSRQWINADGSSAMMIIDAQGNITTRNYSAAGVPTGSTVQFTNAAGGVVTNSYDASGNALGSSVQLTDATGDVTTTSYAGLNGTGNLRNDTWSKTDGSHGGDSFYASGLAFASIYATDGTHTNIISFGKDDSWTVTGQTITVRSSSSYAAADDIQSLTGTGNADLTLTGGARTTTITANSGNDTLVATNATSMLIGGAGQDTFQLGAGQYEIQNANAQDQIVLSNVSSDKLWFQAQGNNLVVSVLGTSEKIAVDNWYAGNQVGTLTAGGQSIGGTDIARLVQAMAAFAPPAAGQLTYTAAEQQALAPMLASSWHH
jgi:hypothetical protein